MMVRIIRKITNRQAQDADTYRYWHSRTPAERTQAAFELTRDGYAAKGIDVHVERSERHIAAFNAHGVEYLIVGGHAVSQHAEPRATKDLDVFIRNDVTNAERVFRALAEYGAPLTGLTVDDFQSSGDDISDRYRSRTHRPPAVHRRGRLRRRLAAPG